MIRKTPGSNTPYALSPGVAVRQDSDDEVTIFDARRGTYCRGNASTKWILQLLEQPATVESITDALQKRYDVDRERLFSDTTTVLTELRAAKLVKRVRQ